MSLTEIQEDRNCADDSSSSIIASQRSETFINISILCLAPFDFASNPVPKFGSLCKEEEEKSRAGNKREILPQPLDLVIADLGGIDGGRGGGGGGIGFWRGWGRFDGWRRKRNRVPILILVCVMLWICGYCKVSGKVIKSDEILKVLGACVFGFSLVKELKREARSLVFVFLCLVASLVFGFNKESFVKLASQVSNFYKLREAAIPRGPLFVLIHTTRKREVLRQGDI
ncbi:hypothetical protein Bca52824_094120 [Brassica carinata]|uniref:Uncharacterized protein n=1 Tax=Brassica carinata TaxID=52824 RepID=A0A8X7TK42_BRACI|nr:hypothetical protein Bca52824_094120 [Brassica carinata]